MSETIYKGDNVIKNIKCPIFFFSFEFRAIELAISINQQVYKTLHCWFFDDLLMWASEPAFES